MILLSDNYRISSDPRNYIIQKRSKSGTGRHEWLPLSYHHSVMGALLKYREICFKSTAKSGQDVLIGELGTYIKTQDEAFTRSMTEILRGGHDLPELEIARCKI